jgi:hypothetical protein
MTLDRLWQLDATNATSNSNFAGANIAENCAPSGINNALRALGVMVTRELAFQAAAISASVSTNIVTSSTGLYVPIVGAGAINSFGLVPGEQPDAAVLRFLHFSSSASISHGGSIFLPGGASIKTQPGDVLGLLHEGSSDQWRAFLYSRSDGTILTNSLSVTTITNRSLSTSAISTVTLNAASASITTLSLTAIASVSASSGKFTDLTVGGHGVLVQRRMQRYTAFTSISASQAIPGDDTIPQISEGLELLSITFTPTNAASIIRIAANWFGGASGVNVNATMAVFQDATANALAAASLGSPGSANTTAFMLEYFTSASNTTQRVYHLRAGPDGGVIYTNGLGGGRLFGGAAGINMTVEEMAPQ